MICVSLAIALTAVSISASQIFLWTSIVMAVGCVIGRSRILCPFSPSWVTFRDWPAPLQAGALLYGWIVISTFVRLVCEPSWASFVKGFQGEWRGLPLFGLGLIVFLFADNDRDRKRLRLSVHVLVGLLLISGLLSVFTEFRLAKIFTGHGTSYSALNRPQHPVAVILGQILYRPIGFMSTKLTYAGLLVLTLPTLFGITFNERYTRKIRALAWGGAALGTGLLLINGTRSAILGALLGWGAWAVWTLWGAVSVRLTSRGHRRLVVGGAALAFLIAAGGFVARDGPERIVNNVVRHTDFQRPIIWSGSAEVVMKRPLFGSGAGFFTRDTTQWRREFLQENPDVWYFFEAAPTGHAHNDLLHFAATAGFPGAALFLWLLFATCKRAWREGESGGHSPAFWFGAAALFVAGTAQCYFQDDRVTLAFWALVGLTSASERANQNT